MSNLDIGNRIASSVVVAAVALLGLRLNLWKRIAFIALVVLAAVLAGWALRGFIDVSPRLQQQGPRADQKVNLSEDAKTEGTASAKPGRTGSWQFYAFIWAGVFTLGLSLVDDLSYHGGQAVKRGIAACTRVQNEIARAREQRKADRAKLAGREEDLKRSQSLGGPNESPKARNRVSRVATRIRIWIWQFSFTCVAASRSVLIVFDRLASWGLMRPVIKVGWSLLTFYLLVINRWCQNNLTRFFNCIIGGER